MQAVFVSIPYASETEPTVHTYNFTRYIPLFVTIGTIALMHGRLCLTGLRDTGILTLIHESKGNYTYDLYNVYFWRMRKKSTIVSYAPTY